MRPSTLVGMSGHMVQVLAFMLFFVAASETMARDRERRINLWGGQATIVRPEGVRMKQQRNRVVMTAEGTDVKVVIERGQIPSKYRGVDNKRIARQARDRLRRQGHEVQPPLVAGKTVRIAFSGTRTVRVNTPRGVERIEVPWEGRLKWLRQTNHRTYQSIITIPEPEKRNPAVRKLRRAAGSLSVPPMKRKPLDRVKDTTASLPLLGERVGSWVPGWKIW